MHWTKLRLIFRKIDPPSRRYGAASIADVFRLGSVLAMILMVFTFFAGCETTTNQQADSSSMIRKTDSGPEVHGEVGAMYGANAH